MLTSNGAAPFIDLLSEKDDESARMVFSDWCEERGHVQLAKRLRDGPVWLRPVKEIDLPQLLEDGDWAQVFADENSGNVSKDVDACPPGSDVDLTAPGRADVAKILAAVNGENDAKDWEGVFELRDGRYLLATGGCDYTGWD